MARADREGSCQTVGRKKDITNSGGDNVYSTEVETILAAFPGALEAAVPDEVMGEKEGAVIVSTQGKELSAGDMRKFAKGGLAEFQIPQFLALLVLPFPPSAAGDVKRASLRDSATWTRERG